MRMALDFKKNDIKEITIGISKNDLDENYEDKKKGVDMPLLEKL